MNRFPGFLIGLCLLLVSCSIFSPSAPSTATPSTSAPSTSAPLPTSTPALPPGVDPFQIPWEDRSIFREGLVGSEQSVLDELDGIADDGHRRSELVRQRAEHDELTGVFVGQDLGTVAMRLDLAFDVGAIAQNLRESAHAAVRCP